MTDTPLPRRSVRSYVKRAGRKTPSQARAFETLWPQFGIPHEPTSLDLDAVFGRRAERVLEIGFGNGDTLVQAAALQPDVDFIGIEVHEPGIGHCLLVAHDSDINNLRIIAHDAIEVLQHQVAAGTLSRINLYFPDPWPKKRHHKRRIVNPLFLSLAADRLQRDGTLHIATDWANYAAHIDEVLTDCAAFALVERRQHDGERPLDRQTTKFERRGLKIGHHIWDWQFRRTSG